MKLKINEKKKKWMRENEQKETRFERYLKRSNNTKSDISLRKNYAAVSCTLVRNGSQSGSVLSVHDIKIKPDQLHYSSCPKD